MSVATEISRIQQAKADIKSSIEAKGVTVPSAALIDDYSDYVDAIQTGGGGGTPIAESVDVSDYTGGTSFDIRKQIIGVNFPSGITSIGNEAFRGCSGLTSVTIPNSVTSIGQYAFRECRSLTSITIPNSVTTISQYAFQICSGLTSVTIGSGVTSISDYTFQSCSSLTSLTISNSVTTIGQYAFSNCTSLTSLTIPNSVTTIDEQAFAHCGLTSLVIGSGVTRLNTWAFYQNESLTTVTSLATTPPTISGNAFYGCHINVIYVPAASVEAYKAANNWSTYADRIQAIPSE